MGEFYRFPAKCQAHCTGAADWKLLFLDFDGVLHPNFSPGDALFSHSKALGEVIDRAKEPPSIVISSSWRFHHQESELLGLLVEPLRRRVIGVTPMVEPLNLGSISDSGKSKPFSQPEYNQRVGERSMTTCGNFRAGAQNSSFVMVG